MTDTIFFTVYGNPKALKRHRNWSKNGQHGNYDPSADEKKDFLIMANEYRPEKPYTCPISLTGIFYFQRPKSHFGSGKNSDKVKENAPKYHISKPDCDNLFKFVGDSLNGIFWKDDSFICKTEFTKLYSDNPRTEIIIKTLNND